MNGVRLRAKHSVHRGIIPYIRGVRYEQKSELEACQFPLRASTGSDERQFCHPPPYNFGESGASTLLARESMLQNAISNLDKPVVLSITPFVSRTGR